MAKGLVVAPKTFVLDLIDQYCKCQRCARKLKKINKLLEKIHGIHSTSIDSNAGRVTISGFVDPQEVIRVLKKNNIKADVSLEEIIPSTDNHKMQIATPSRRVDPESHKQNLVAQVQQFVDNSGLKELELTFKATFNGKNKDKMITTSLESDHTHKKIVMDDDPDHCPKSQGHCCGRHGGGAHVGHGGVPNCSPWGQVHNPYNSYGGNYGPLESNSWSPAQCGGPPIDPAETPWQRDYFPPPPAPVAGYEPSAPPWYGNHDESPSSCITSPMVVFLLVVVIYLLLFR